MNEFHNIELLNFRFKYNSCCVSTTSLSVEIPSICAITYYFTEVDYELFFSIFEKWT